MANRVTAQQWNQTKKRTANAMANQFFADVNMGTQGISDLLNQQNSADKLKNLTMKKNEVNSLLRRAEDMRQQYAGNKSMLGSVDSATTLLKNISTSIDNVMPQTHKLGFGNSGSDDVSKVLNSENVGRIVAENQQNFNLDMYKRNKGLSFDEISQKQHENTINMNDENRARLNKENRWLDMYKESMATDDDYKKLVNNASKRIAELKKEDKDDIYMPTARDSEALKNAHDTRRKNREKEMEYYQGIIDRYSDDAKYGRSNIEKWKNDVKDLSYSDKKKYIEQLGTNTYQKDLEKELNSYESGKEYINNLADGEKPSAQGFFAYLDDNNKNLYHEMKKNGVKNPTEEKNNLMELSKKASEWKSNDDEINYLENYAKSTVSSYEDYQTLNDEYQKKIDNSKTAAEADKWKYEFSSKYGDNYLRTKQEHNFKSLPENEQQEMIDTIRKQYNTDSRSGNFNPYDSQSVEDMKQYGRNIDVGFEDRKLKELKEKYNFTDSEAQSIIAYAKATVNEELQQKEYEEYYAKGEQSGKIGPGILGKVTGAVASTLQSVPYSLASGIGAAETIWTKLKQGFGGETPVDYNSEGMRIGQRGSAIREGAKSNYDEMGQFIYDAFASTVDSAATLPIDAVVPGATAIILGSSAATQGMLDGHEKGLSDAQAIGQGVAAGIFEGLFEKVSLDKIIEMGDGVSSVKGVLSNIAKSVGIEGSEEGFTEIANILYDDLANGELSDYKISVSDYKKQGYSQSESEKLAKKDLAVRIAQSVGGGALGGAFMGIPVSGYNYAKNKEHRTMAKTGDAILRNNGFEELQEHIAQNYDEESNLYKQMANTDINDSAQVGFLASLAAENEYNQAMESYSNTVNEAVSNRLQELNVPKQIADNMAPTVLGNKNVNAGQYQETYNQVKQELVNGITGREDNWVSDIDLTDRDNHLENARTIEKLAVGESLRKGLSKSVTNDVKSKIDEKKESGELSANGTAHLIDNPDVEFTPVELIVGTDGKTQVIANDGSNYKMSDVAADANTVAIAELGEQYEPEQRKKFFKAYEQTGDVLSPLSFASYFNMAYDYGKNNLGQASVFNNSRLRNNLTLDQIGMAYDAGKLEYIKNLQKNKADTKINIRGTVSFDGVDESRLNETQKSAVRVAKVISKAVGCKITFFESGKNQEGKYVGANGSYNSKTNELRIDINAGKVSETEGHNIMILTLSHELTHYAENFAHKEYAELQEFVFDVLSKNTGKDIKELIAEEMEHQRRQNREHGTNIEVTESRAKSELVARGCELVLTDAETIRELAERNRGLFGKIKAKIIEFTDSIINACKEILGKDGNIKNDVISKEAMQMKEYAEKLRTLWNEAVGAAGESNAVKSEKNSVSGGVREMIRYDSDNTPFVEIDKDIFKGVTNKKERIKLVKEAIRDSFSTGIEIDEGNVWSSGKTRKEFTDSKYSNWLKRKHKIIYTRKLRMAGNADEIVKSVKKYSYETPLHPRKDNLIGFYRGDTKIRIGKFDYTADVILALDSSNKMYFYDIINMENTKIEEPTEPGSQMNENNKRLVNSSINSISRNSENDNNILKQDRNTDVIKKAANKLGVSERFLESNLEGRSRESAVQYLRNNNQVKNSFISEKGLEVTPVLKEPTSSYGMSDNIKEFVRDNNISYKILSENSRLREEYAKLIEHSKDGLGKKFLERRAQDKAQEFIDDMDGAMSGDTEAKEKISREIELAKGKAKAYDDGMSMERGWNELIKNHNKEFKEFISFNIAPMYNNAERNKKEFAQNVKDNVESYVEKAEKHFGTTNDYSLAAYIDINGKMLDFSDGGAIRGTDHRGIAEVLDTPSGVSGTEALTAFMNAGNIRIMDTGIDISVEPNEKQISVLRDYIASRNGEIYVDFSKEDGSPAGSARYSKGTSGGRILADINNYFEDGTIPENTYNAMSDFLYQSRINAITDAESMTQDNGIASYTEERLEDLYTDYAAMNEDYSQAYLTRLSPEEFLKLTTEDDDAYNRIISESTNLDKEKLRNNSQPIYLRIYDDGEVRGHEGRHRMAALMNAGITSVPLVLIETSDNYGKEIGNIQRLDSQDFSFGRRDYSVKLGDSIPITRKNDALIREKFLNSGDVLFQDRTISPRTYSLKLKDNVNFKDGRQNADEMYRKTKGVELSDRAIDMLVKKLEKDSGTNVSSDVLHKKLKKTFENARTKDLTGNELVKELRKIAAFALNDKNDKQRRTTYAQNILNEVRKNKVYVTERQRSYLKRETGLKYEEWRRSMFGKVNLTNNVEDGVTLDAMWQEYSRLYPEVFKSDVKVEEQPLELEKITFALSNEYANNYGFNFDDAALYCATELMATYSYLTEVKKQSGITTDIDGIYDKYQKDMSNVRVEYYNLNREYNKRYQGELNRLRKEWRDDQKYHEQNLRQKYASMIKQREADIRNREDSVWTTREKEKVRNHIIKTVKSISNMIVNPSNQRHAPEGFKSKVAEFCQQFLKDTSVFQYDDLDRLKVAYEALRGDNDSYSLAGSYDSDIDDMLTVLKNTIRNRRLSKLDRVELEQVKDIVDHFRFIIENENKIWSQGKTMNLERTGLSVIDELSAKKDKVLKRTKSEGVNSLLDKVDGFVENNYTPIYFFKKLGPTFEKLYSDVRKGQDDWGKNIAKATRRISDIKEKYNYDKWDRKRALKLGGGITLNTEQAMYIYATRQREMQNETQEARHLQQGGIIMEDRVTVKDGKVIKKQKVQQQAYKITDGDLVRLGSFLTMEQKAYVNELVNYLSVDMAKLGNETSMKLYGIKKFGESYYFPYKVAGSEISTTASGRGKVTPSLKNAGMTKALTKKAGNAIIVDDFTDTAARHISQMCTYNALAVAQDNINRIYNFKDLKWDDEAEAMVGTGMTVKQLLDAKEGEDAGKYLELFLASINNGLTIDPTEGLTNQLISKFKKGAVYASLSVAIQQPSAICRAFALVDPKYFAQTTFKKRDWEECKKYNGVAVIKELGGFDTGTGQGAVDYLTDSRADSKIGRTVEKIDNGLGRLPGYMDQITWCHIWNAVKAEIKDKYNFNGNEAEFFKKASERFDEVINLTQVYDSVLAKSVNMNSKSGLMKSATAFMSEPTVTLNMLNDALQNGNRKYICRAVSAIVLQTVVNAALKALVQAARNSSSDDEEKSYVEKYAKAFSGDVVGDINPLTWIPVVKDIVNIFQGYDVERADLSLITDLYNACQTVMKARDGKKSPEEAVQKMSEAIAAFFGVPLTNINRDIRAVRNLFNDVISNNVLSKGHVGRAFLEGLGITTSNADIINDYIDSGDRKEVDELIGNKKVEIKEKYPSYSDEKVSREAISGVRSLITKQLKSRYLENPERKSEIVDFMKKTKMYTEVKKKKTVDVSEGTVNGWLITELKKQYINSTDAGDRAEIKRQLWATKHWKRLRELEKQLKEWTE